LSARQGIESELNRIPIRFRRMKSSVLICVHLYPSVVEKAVENFRLKILSYITLQLKTQNYELITANKIKRGGML
jgi:hypothetical protein